MLPTKVQLSDALQRRANELIMLFETNDPSLSVITLTELERKFKGSDRTD